VAEAKAISQAPTGLQRASDSAFRGQCYSFAWLSVLAVVFIVLRIAFAAAPAVRQYGLGFLTLSVS
jgi:phosphate transport system permease protein